jgi:hypothetical protein
MADIAWLPEHPADTVLAARVEAVVHETIGRDAIGTVTISLDEDGTVHVHRARLVPAPAVWDTWGEPIRVDEGVVEALRLFGIRAR